MSKRTLALLLAAAAALGFAGGWLYRRATRPTLEEQVRDATGDLEEKLKSFGR
jgi:hypothetical protein